MTFLRHVDLLHAINNHSWLIESGGKMRKLKLCISPVDGDGDKREDAGGHRARRDELGEFAVEPTKRPVAVQ